MELSLEESLDIFLELLSTGFIIAIMFGMSHTPMMIALLERMM